MEQENVQHFEVSSMKSYKLNKTFENSTYPLELELKNINNNTISSTLSNLVGIIFSGIGTSLLFDSNGIATLWLGDLFNYFKLPNEGYSRVGWTTIIYIFVFALLFLIGTSFNKSKSGKNSLYKKKGTNKGRSELREDFHKSIINDIVIGLSFVDKAEEIGYSGDVADMYLYEAVYYFTQAKIQMEEIELLSPEKSSEHQKFIDEIGEMTIKCTCKVFHSGLIKLFEQLPDGKEKKDIGDIRDALEPYL